MDQALYNFRAIIGHKVALNQLIPTGRGGYNVQIEWETGKIALEPLGVIAAADDPITFVAYAKEKNPYNFDG